MESNTKLILAWSSIIAIEVIGWTTVVYLVRRWKKVEPHWPWWRMLGSMLLLAVIVTAIRVIPVAGMIGAPVASLIGLKRQSGLDLLAAFMLSFFVGVSIYVLIVVVGKQMQIDLMGL